MQTDTVPAVGMSMVISLEDRADTVISFRALASPYLQSSDPLNTSGYRVSPPVITREVTMRKVGGTKECVENRDRRCRNPTTNIKKQNKEEEEKKIERERGREQTKKRPSETE